MVYSSARIAYSSANCRAIELSPLVDLQQRPDDGRGGWPLPKGRHHGARLVGRGRILRIENRDDLAACKGQGVVESLWLGPRQSRRNWDHFETGGQGGRDDGGDRLGIIGLHQQLHIEEVARVVETRDRRDQLRHNIGFAVERHEDAKRWKVFVVRVQRRRRRPACNGRNDRQEAHRNDHGKNGCDRNRRYVHRRLRADIEPDRVTNRQDETDDPLLGIHAPAGAVVWSLHRQLFARSGERLRLHQPPLEERVARFSVRAF